MSQFFLTWSSYKSNICNGLSSLQQKEEFVDLTLAADGHFVKVHQMIVSLASPYLKELIKSASCSHPVIFLNKISYPILCCILEYVYSGEVLVNKESLPELLEAGKALHIKGLDGMSPDGYSKNEDSYPGQPAKMEVKLNPSKSSLVDGLHKYKSQPNKDFARERNIVTVESTSSRDFPTEEDNMSDPFTDIGGDNFHDNNEDDDSTNGENFKIKSKSNVASLAPRPARSPTLPGGSDLGSKTVQYTLSNQGSLQLVLNRFVYFLRYAHKNSNPPVRQWRCVDYIRNRCPASVTTKDDIVVQRVAAHKHPFHDKKIVKKIQSGAIFTAIKDAEKQGKRFNKNQPEEDKSLSDKE